MQLITKNTLSPTALRIRELNDALRTHRKLATFMPLAYGRLVITSGVRAEGGSFVFAAITKMRRFDAFTSDNDPHGEHDFGAFTHDGVKLFWKIDYYARAEAGGCGEAGSEDPADISKSYRLLTLLRADEY